MISHSRVWSQNKLLFDPLSVFVGTACMTDSQLQSSQGDGKSGYESTNRSLCLLQPEPLEVCYFLYILSPKEGTPFLKRQDRAKQITSGTCSTSEDGSLLPNAFSIQACYKQDFKQQQCWELNAKLGGHETPSPV